VDIFQFFEMSQIVSSESLVINIRDCIGFLRSYFKRFRILSCLVILEENDRFEPMLFFALFREDFFPLQRF
jgi:hypothetical protein